MTKMTLIDSALGNRLRDLWGIVEDNPGKSTAADVLGNFSEEEIRLIILDAARTRSRWTYYRESEEYKDRAIVRRKAESSLMKLARAEASRLNIPFEKACELVLERAKREDGDI